jgi:protein involved in polysaccharide export with SLBB domain
VDFEKLFLRDDKIQDVILRPGDVIYISDNKKQVYVYGQVNKPGFVPLKEGADYTYYIEKAGGLGDRSNDSEIRVIKFRTREWLEPDEARIESGDYVYVPKLIKRDFAYDIDLVAKVASVVVSVITLALLIIQTQ